MSSFVSCFLWLNWVFFMIMLYFFKWLVNYSFFFGGYGLILEKEMATHSSTLAWKIWWTEKPGRLQCMGSQRVRHGWATSLSLSKLDSDSRSLKNCSARPCASLPVRHQQTILEFWELEEITKFCIFLKQREFFQIRLCMWFQYWKEISLSWGRSWGPLLCLFLIPTEVTVVP